MKPGANMRNLHVDSVNMLLQGIEDAGVLSRGEARRLMLSNSYGRLYPHTIGESGTT